MNINKIALTLANGDTEQAEIKAYYIKSMVHTGSTLAVILLASYLLNVVQYALIVIFTLRFLRTKTGGCHSKSITSCKVLSFFIVVGLALIVSVIKISNVAMIIWTFFVLLFGLYMIYKVVPLDSPQRPIISKQFRQQLRTKAYVFYLIITASVYTFTIIGYSRWAVAILLALSTQLFLMTKSGYWVVAQLDNVFDVR